MIYKNPNEAVYEEISNNIHKNLGYCVCELQKTPDTRCMCKAFRESTKNEFCNCGRYYKLKEYMIITLCGSTRFKDEFLAMQQKLTLEGYIVLTVGVFGHADSVETTPEMKEQLDDLHRAKIAMSDAIFVINKDGYIGESTEAEIEWAQNLGKSIYYLEEKGE